MRPRFLLWLPLLATALAVAGGDDRGAPDPTPCAPAPALAAVPRQPPAALQSAGAAAEQTVASGSLLMPDGTSLPPLNGAVDPPRPRWQRGRPYAPVVRTDRLADGRETYVHADGSRTTTFMTWRKDLGRMVAVTSVSSPAAAQPTIDAETPPGR